MLRSRSTGPPPTSFLQPAVGSDMSASQKRVSRTEMDFETALRAEHTVMLKEGPDLSSLGHGADSPGPAGRFHSPPTKSITPTTPTVIPPTPTPAAGQSSAMRVTGLPPSSSSASGDVFSDTTDSEHQVKRRSMYRSPGTSSSPDLATLLRKSKERGGALVGHHKHEKRRESPPPLPDRTSNGNRHRPSSNQSPPVTPLPKKNKLQRNPPGDASPEWVMPSPRPMENGSPKPARSSVRAKTSAFLGKMLGQSTVRERSKTDAGASSPSSLLQAFNPPVPSVPSEFRRQSAGPSSSPIADVFTSSSPKDTTPTILQTSLSKPLPPIMGQLAPDLDDDRSMVFVEKLGTPSPQKMMRSKSAETSGAYGKRRSMSVGDVELKQALAASLAMASKRASEEDTTLNGILDDFQGELSQLETASTSLDLRDPSTPARRAAYMRSKTDGAVSSPSRAGNTTHLTKHVSLTTPILTLNLEDGDARPELSPIVPPRTSSLQTPSMTSSAPSAFGSPRGPGSRHGSSPLRSSTGPTPSRGLRGMHRSTASSSEPSLIPLTNGDGPRKLPIPPSTSQQDLGVIRKLPTPPLATSPQDLTVHDITLKRFPSSSPSRGENDEDPDARAKELAQRCWSEDEEFLAKEKIAEWLGGTGAINKATLQYYVDFFDFSNLRLDLAFRRLCSKLYLKGETQQVDRILAEFSRRYWDCNPTAVFGSANIVHAVSYSLLLLNTDLHVADLTTRMSKSQFVRNTLTAIQTQLEPTPSEASDSSPDSSSLHNGGSESTHTESRYRSKRSDSITSWNSISKETIMSSPAFSFASTATMSSDAPTEPSSQDLKSSISSTHSYGRPWEIEMENLLKDMYNAIKSSQILQPLSGRSSMSSLTPGSSSMLRNRSLRGPPDRLATLKRGSIRGLQSILTQNGASPYSSNSSIDGRVSPSPSFATSTHDVYGSSSSFLAPTLGFAHNLSHTIIREAKEDDSQSVHSEHSDSTTISISDEELALLGAPWAKEGMLCRKQYWEAANKRAKDKSWLDVFVVIQRGELSMFTFGEHGSGSSGAMGGGNWLANANSVGTVQLTHSLAHALPPPGYNRQRPYCMVLTLSHGGVYFFQAGTEELVNEWVSTCNYWAARTSKEPLAGGVSNMEYGWNRVEDPVHHRSQSDSESTKDDSMSIMSGRSSHSRFGWRDGAATVRATRSPWNDRIYINDWKPPLPPGVSSDHDEEAQMEALRKHVAALKHDLQKHNELQQPMQALYQPRTTNWVKAQSNFEKKSQYLLTEIVKYDLYIDSLQAAMTLRLKKRGEKALERALNGGNSPEESASKWKGPNEATIEEDDEPSTPGPEHLTLKAHRRELASGGDEEDD
ncbi:hypothetical protein BDZ89DRAFT_1168897 [Hymenopellis radicata]|nr:hypothetical protein BDZ89DRAFT_1168897 [Hymenopellis radicata]